MKLYKQLLLTLAISPGLMNLAQADYIAHEWGTFTSLVGSNGVTQHGMYHEDEVLPEFVHSFGETQPIPTAVELASSLIDTRLEPCRQKFCPPYDDFFNQNVITQKMETPVIYFYGNDKEKVTVDVHFPEGIITETYPAPVKTSPTRETIRQVKDGHSQFQVEILAETNGNLPYVDAGNIYGHARNVDSNLVKTNQEIEKFIFYRGIGRFQPKIDITSTKGNLKLQAQNYRSTPQAAFLVHVNSLGQSKTIRLLNEISIYPERISAYELQLLKSHAIGMDAKVAKTSIVSALVDSGLKNDEAVAMLDTWEHGYLKVPGLRLLYILPRAEVDEVLPLEMNPAPEKLVRSFVGRIEILLDTDENTIIQKVSQEGEKFSAKSLGRFSEPMLRRAKEVYQERHPNIEPSDRVLNLFDRFIREASLGE
ncbi:MAG: hypothetical protein M9962_07295 [Oligoflexia bacterium]|nr:hypothetical protein [Oligoflexia bacterium]